MQRSSMTTAPVVSDERLTALIDFCEKTGKPGFGQHILDALRELREARRELAEARKDAERLCKVLNSIWSDAVHMPPAEAGKSIKALAIEGLKVLDAAIAKAGET